MYIGLDIGGTKILGGLIAGGKILKREKVKTKANESQEDIYTRIASVITILSKGVTLQGIGVGIPGNVSKAGEILVSPNLPFKNFPLQTMLEKEFNVPICIDNDVNVGLLGEQAHGIAKKKKNVVGLFIGTGIGGAVIINNQLIQGTHNIAGEIGHMKLKLNGPACGCGAQGCLEALASKIAIQKQLEQKGVNVPKPLKSSFLKSELDKNNKEVKAVLKKAATHIGEAIGNIANALDPDLFVVGGGVMEAIGPFMIKHMTPKAEKRALGKINIKASSLGDDALLWGAVTLLK